jgi:L-ascorbate metabolism protein UlaG (beta-lactamase superfamily)
MRYAGTGLLAITGTGLVTGLDAIAQATGAVTVQWLGHTCFLITSGGKRLLINPFRSLGCTAKYRPPKVAADLVMISSQLLDEGAIEVVPGDPQLLYEPGDYQVAGLRIRGIAIPHDRIGGKQFGSNTAWQWNQAGISFLHMGGSAAPISLEQKILAGRPDVVFMPIGGGPKAYNADEAKQAILTLNPRLIIPTHYRTAAADSTACDIGGLNSFLELMKDTPVRKANSDTITLKKGDLPKEGMAIQVMTYNFTSPKPEPKKNTSPASKPKK